MHLGRSHEPVCKWTEAHVVSYGTHTVALLVGSVSGILYAPQSHTVHMWSSFFSYTTACHHYLGVYLSSSIGVRLPIGKLTLTVTAGESNSRSQSNIIWKHCNGPNVGCLFETMHQLRYECTVCIWKMNILYVLSFASVDVICDSDSGEREQPDFNGFKLASIK